MKHDHKGDGDNKTELKDSHLNIDLGTVVFLLLLGIDHGVVIPDTAGPDEGDQHHSTETVVDPLGEQSYSVNFGGVVIAQNGK